jgi:hypothetical protein
VVVGAGDGGGDGAGGDGDGWGWGWGRAAGREYVDSGGKQWEESSGKRAADKLGVPWLRLAAAGLALARFRARHRAERLGGGGVARYRRGGGGWGECGRGSRRSSRVARVARWRARGPPPREAPELGVLGKWGVPCSEVVQHEGEIARGRFEVSAIRQNPDLWRQRCEPLAGAAPCYRQRDIADDQRKGAMGAMALARSGTRPALAWTYLFPGGTGRRVSYSDSAQQSRSRSFCRRLLLSDCLTIGYR